MGRWVSISSSHAGVARAGIGALEVFDGALECADVSKRSSYKMLLLVCLVHLWFFCPYRLPRFLGFLFIDISKRSHKYKYIFKQVRKGLDDEMKTWGRRLSHGLVSKESPNLPIWWKYLELRGIMMNKYRIYREIRKFMMISSKLIKSDDELMIEIGENGKLWKRTSNRFHGIKNHRIWLWFRGEIKDRSRENFSKS